MTVRGARWQEKWAALSVLTLTVFACSGGATGEGNLVKGGVGGGFPACGAPEDCNDGDLCTLDTCAEGICAHAATSCDDHDTCTVDSCDAVAGCVHAAVSADDGDACTADACDPASGVVHVLVSCDDGDLCATDGCDAAVGCVHEPIAKIDDDNACTEDACDPMTGVVTHALKPGCCPHSACLTGAPMNFACSYPGLHNNCVAKICDEDPFCCLTAWDSTCVAHTRDPAICPTGFIPSFFSCLCSHAYCDVGAPLAKCCDPCVKKVCDVDPTCCLSVWDAICVSEVQTLCDVPSGADCQ